MPLGRVRLQTCCASEAVWTRAFFLTSRTAPSHAHLAARDLVNDFHPMIFVPSSAPNWMRSMGPWEAARGLHSHCDLWRSSHQHAGFPFCGKIDRLHVF